MSTFPQSGFHDDAAAVCERCRIDLNTAPEDALAELDALGPARIEALLYRRPFRDWDDVARVPGISQSIIERLKSSGAGIW